MGMWRAGASALVLAACAFGRAEAQTAAPAEEARQPTTVGEVIVTAQRREQSLQDVPVSVAAISGEVFAERNITDFAELQQITPGLNFAGANTPRGAGVSIRGVGTVTFSEGIEGSVGIVLDGVPIGRQGAGFTELVDLERVEILRGPQGTLFGKNASAGVINIVTKRPSAAPSAEGAFSYGENRDLKIQGGVSGPLGLDGDLRGRLSTSISSREGNVFDVSGTDYNDREEVSIRGKLEWDATEDLNLLLSADYTARDVECCIWTTRSYGPAGLFNTGFNVIRQQQQLAGVAAGPGNRKVALSGDIYQKQLVHGLVGEVNYSLGDFTLTSVTGYRTWVENDNNDADQTPLDLLDVNLGDISQEQFTQELRLTTPTGGRFEGVAGLFYFDQTADTETLQRGSYGLYLLNPLVPPSLRFGRAISQSVDTENFAVFGDITWNVTDRFRVFGGARYVNEQVDFRFDRRIAPNSLQFALGGPSYAPLSVRDSVEETAWTYRAGLQYDLTPDVMVYATAARGFKGPGFNALVDLTVVRRVEPEIPTSYEAGIKAALFDDRLQLNAALFHTTFEDFQAQSLTTTGTTLSFDIRNAGELETQGLEADFTAVPLEGLTLSGGFALIDAVYNDFEGAECYSGQFTLGTGCVQLSPGVFVQDLSGEELPGSPDLTYNLTARYERDLGGSGLSGFGQLAYAWRDETLTAQDQDPRSLQESYGLLDGALGISDPDQGWTLTLFAKNITDENYAELIFDTPFDSGSATALGGQSQFVGFNAQRTVGVRFDFAY